RRRTGIGCKRKGEGSAISPRALAHQRFGCGTGGDGVASPCLGGRNKDDRENRTRLRCSAHHCCSLRNFLAAGNAGVTRRRRRTGIGCKRKGEGSAISPRALAHERFGCGTGGAFFGSPCVGGRNKDDREDRTRLRCSAHHCCSLRNFLAAWNTGVTRRRRR